MRFVSLKYLQILRKKKTLKLNMSLIHTYMLIIFLVVVISQKLQEQLITYHQMIAKEVVFDYTPLEDGLTVKVGASKIEVGALYSPGHTIGSTSFIIDHKYLLTGDNLFIDSIGRPDLAGLAEDWVGDLRETLYRRYRELAEDLIVLPAHFMVIEELNEDGTVAKRLGDLFAENHGLNIDNEDEFRKTVTDNLPPQPNAYQQIRQVNMGKITPDNDEQTEMEIGPNRCAVR
ncbi:hypothetical protein UACE39S_03506 [Ureibacillus acetophenoni]